MSELSAGRPAFVRPIICSARSRTHSSRRQAHRLRAGQKALSVADGEGRNGVWLAEQGLDVLTIDFSATALAKAQALAQDRGVRIATEVADLNHWRWPKAAFDVIVGDFYPFRRRRARYVFRQP